MPSTRLMPVVMTSSLQVWSRLARDILLRPISVQYTVSFAAKHTTYIYWWDKMGWWMRSPQKYLCPQTKQLMKPHFTAAWPISPNVVWDYKVWWRKYPHSSSTALGWHTVPEQERQLLAKFYRPVYCLMQNTVLVKLLWTLYDFKAPLHKHIK